MKVRVLIADDNRDFASLLGVFLEKDLNVEVIGIAKNGIQTLSMVQQQRPDVLLLDIIMPDIDGFDTLKGMHAFSDKPRVIVVSAVGNERIRTKALSLGASGYFIKPVNMQRLLACILGEYYRISHHMEERVAAFLHRCNVPKTMKGFFYLQDMIKCSMQNKTPSFFGLCRAVADAEGTTPLAVQQAVHRAIQAAWSRRALAKDHFFDAWKEKKPTTDQFIHAAAQCVEI